MTDVYLIRHAQCTGNVENKLTGKGDYDLAEEGKMQVQLLTNYLKNIKFDKVYSSPLKRTIKTIAPIAKLENINIQLSQELEEMDFGIYDGFTWEQVDKLDNKIMHNSKKEIMGIPKQETTKQVQKRMKKIMKRIVKENPNKTILVCSHGIAIEAFLREIAKVPFNVESKKFSQGNTSVNIISYDEKKKKFYIKDLCETKHLQQTQPKKSIIKKKTA